MYTYDVVSESVRNPHELAADARHPPRQRLGRDAIARERAIGRGAVGVSWPVVPCGGGACAAGGLHCSIAKSR
jgi:hypothetical protein